MFASVSNLHRPCDIITVTVLRRPQALPNGLGKVLGLITSYCAMLPLFASGGLDQVQTHKLTDGHTISSSLSSAPSS